MWLWSWTDSPAPTYLADMNANQKIRARYRAREAQAKANEKRYRRDRDNADDAATIRAMLHRVGAIDLWEHKRLDQAAEHVRADATKKRANYFAGMQAAVDRMRERGQTLAAIAALVEVDVREVRAALRRGLDGTLKEVARRARPARVRGVIAHMRRMRERTAEPQRPTPPINIRTAAVVRAVTTRCGAFVAMR